MYWRNRFAIPVPAPRRLRLIMWLGIAAMIAIIVAQLSYLWRDPNPTPSTTQPAAAAASLADERTPEGAATAAARILNALTDPAMFDAHRRDERIDGLVAAQPDPRLLEDIVGSYEIFRSQLGLPDSGFEGRDAATRFIPVGWRPVTFTEDLAKVDIWSDNLYVHARAAVPAVVAWDTQRVTLVWENGAWRLYSVDHLEGPQPENGMSATDAAGTASRAHQFRPFTFTAG